jgi:hypothetical protein
MMGLNNVRLSNGGGRANRYLVYFKKKELYNVNEGAGGR